jgi:polysaccharide pyruvyl transferase WcaK-like protein
LPDKLVRENLKIASLSTSYNSHGDTLKSYFNADLIISNRFHSNIISIVLGKKFMPLINYPQIRSLFGGLPKTFPFPILDESCPEQWEQNFLKVLHEREENYEEYRNLVLEDLSKQRNHVEELLLAWLTKKLLK